MQSTLIYQALEKEAPFNIVERMYGDEIFYEDAFNELVPSIYEKEIEDNKLDVVSKPEINIVKMKKGEDLVFTAIVQTKPEVKLGKYKGVELKWFNNHYCDIIAATICIGHGDKL